MATERTVSVRGKAAMGELNAAIKQSGKVTREFNAELKKAMLLQQQFEQTQKKAAASNAAVAGQMAKAKKATEDARLATAKHSMIVGGVLVAAFAAAEYATLGFDRQMSAVGAASGATGKDLADLRDAAIAAGQATVFGAQDAARAEEELAKAGVSVKDVLSGGLIGSLNLATAGNLDLGRAAEIAASTMTQFKLAGKDIPHIADLLAAGAGKAQGSVEDLGLAMTYVGPVAGQMGVSVEETTGTMAELASNGILAEKAGTGLRGVLMALTSPSAKAADTMKQLGINVYDSHGKFVGFRGVAEQLHRSLSGLSAQQRDVALGQIFGNEQIVAARVLYAGGAQAVDDWTAKVNDSGYAARFAAARMDNLAGDLEQLKGSLETALIKGGTGATDVLRALAKAATGAVNAFSDLPGPVQTSATATAALVGGVLLAAGAYGTFMPKLRLARAELEATGRAGTNVSKAIGALGKIGGVVSALAAVYYGLHALSDEFDRLVGHGRMDPAVLAQHYGDLFVELAAGKAPVASLAQEIGQLSAMVAAGGVKADAGRRGIAGLDAEMANFARGDAKNAQKVMQTLTDALGAQGFTADQVAAMFPQYAAALKAAQAQNVLTAGSQDDLTGSIQGTSTAAVTFTSLMAGSKITTDGLAEATKGASDALGEFNAEYDYFIGRNVDAVVAEANFKQALVDASKSLKDNKNSFDENTDAGRANIKTIGDLMGQADSLAQSVLKQTGSSDQATLAYWRQVDAIRGLLPAGSEARKALDALLGRMLGVSATKVKPTIDANIADALKKINAVKVALSKVGNKTVTYRFVTDTTGWMLPPGAGPAVATFAGGGIVGKDTSGRDPRDRIPILGRVGEAMITPEARREYGLTDAVVHAMNAGRAVPVAAAIGGLSGSASGGGGAGLSNGDRALMRQFISAAHGLAGLAALADRPVHASISEREVYEANRRQVTRNQARR